MKRKLFTLLTLLLCVCTGAWATETTVTFTAANKNDAGTNFAEMSNGNTQLVGSGIAKLIATNSVTLSTSTNKYGYRCEGSRLYIVFKFDGTTDLTIKHNTNSTGERYMRLYSFSSDKALKDITSSDWATKTQKPFSSTSTTTTWGGGQSSAVTTNVDKTSWNYTTKGCLTVTWSNLPAGYYVMDGTGSEAYIYSFTADVAAAGPSHSVSAVTSTGTDTYGTVSAASTTVAEGSTTAITASPAAGYKVTNWAVSGTGSSISPSGESNSLTTTLTMGTADATVTVTFGEAAQLDMTHTLSNVTKTSGAVGTNSIYELTQYTAVFAAADGYKLPNAITVTRGALATDITANCTWNKSTGTVTIPYNYVTDDITITVTGVEEATLTPITSATTWTFNSGFASEYATTTIVEGKNIEIIADSDHRISIDGNSVTCEGTSYSGRLKFGGAGSSSSRCVHFKLGSGTYIIKTYATHAKGSGDARSLGIKTDGTETAFEIPTSGVVIAKVAFTCTEDKDVYIYSKNSGVNLSAIFVKPATTLSLLNAKGYATYSKATDFDFAGATAYKMALDEGEKTITGTEVKGMLKAGEGILFKGAENGTVTIAATTGATALTGNDLKGSTKDDGTTADKPTYCYVLSGDTFVSYTGASLSPNKAYFEATKDLSAHAFTIIFDDGEVTSIANVEAKKFVENNKFYNLAGQRVAQPTKGLYIVNGKKVVIK